MSDDDREVLLPAEILVVTAPSPDEPPDQGDAPMPEHTVRKERPLRLTRRRDGVLVLRDNAELPEEFLFPKDWTFARAAEGLVELGDGKLTLKLANVVGVYEIGDNPHAATFDGLFGTLVSSKRVKEPAIDEEKAAELKAHAASARRAELAAQLEELDRG